MRFFNWAESFKEQPTCENILKKVQTIEMLYWIFLLLSVIIALLGVFIMILVPVDNLKALFWGLFLAIDGTIQVTLIKMWAHIKLSMYRIIWDSQNRIENEIRKSEAADL
jgi:hypothetical protein